MIYLILAVLSSSLISIFMRLSTGKTKNLGTLFINYAVCLVISGLFTNPVSIFSKEVIANNTFLLGLITGIFYLASFMLFQMNVAKRGIVLSSVFMKLGLLVPIVLSLTLFHEKPSLVQIIGFVLAVVTIVLINLGNPKGGRFGVGLPLLLLIGGVADGMSKVFEEIGEEAYKPQFLLFTFLFALISTGVLMLIKKEKLTKNELFYGVLIGVPNFFSAKFLLMALGSTPAVIAYPTFSVGTIVITTLSGVFLFKERLKPIQWIALVGIMVALVLLNI